MSVTQTIYDWLGNKLSGSSASVITANAAKCAYMELARLIGASYVSAAIQACDIRFYDASGKRDMGDEAWLWNVSPNPNQSATQLMDAIVHGMFADGQALVIPFTSNFDGASTLWPADEWTPANVSHGIGIVDRFSSVTVAGKPMSSDFTASQVYRFDLDATPDKRFTALKKAVGNQYSNLADSAADAYTSRNVRRYKWKRGSSQSGDRAEQDKQQAFMQDQVQKFVTSESVAVWPEFTGNELEAFTDTTNTANASTDFVAIRKDMFELAATCMRMPTSMLYGNVNNFSTVFDSFITFAIDPVAKVIANEITRKTYTQKQWASGAHCDLDTSQIKHRDIYDAASDIDKLIADGVNSVNDTLRDFARDTIDEPWADEHLRTKNYETAGNSPDANPGGENND